MAKGKKTGGRQKGTRNIASAARVAEVAATGLTPLEYMLEVMRNSSDSIIRFEAAKACAPYIHPRLASTEVTGKGGKDFIPSETEIAQRIAYALTAGVIAKAKESSKVGEE